MYTIFGLFINREELSGVGLFGYAENLHLTDLTLRVDITGKDHVGGMVGHLEQGSISNVHLSGAVRALYTAAGGLAGRSLTTTITQSTAAVEVSGSTNDIAGLVGNVQNGTVITDCFATGSATGKIMVGGLAGTFWGATMENSYATGNVIGRDSVGGLVGSMGMSTVRRSFATGNVTATADGTVNFGGLAGRVENSGAVYDCYAKGEVTGVDLVGGLVGYFTSDQIIADSFSTGRVIGTSRTGGLIGENVRGAVSRSFYNVDTSGMTDTGKGEPKTSAEMQLLSTFGGWDFDTTWEINEELSYPYLAWRSLAGHGTESDPFQVTSAESLDYVRNYRGADYAGFHFIQLADIDLGLAPWNEGGGWEPIGGFLDEVAFRGIYDGNGYTIHNLTINTTSSEVYAGLFGRIGYLGSINNVRLENIAITATGHAGGLAGYMEGGGTLSNCQVTGEITLSNGMQWYAGGFVGYLSGNIENSSAAVSIHSTSGENLGGLAGAVAHVRITNSYANGDISGSRKLGGLVGAIWNNVVIENTYATGRVSGLDTTGGLVGAPGADATITRSYYNSETSGQSDTGKGEPLTTSEMLQQVNFVDWNFPDTWQITEGVTYPYLSQHASTSRTPVLVAPIYRSSVSEINPTLVWLPVMAPAGKQIVDYQVQLDTAADFQSVNFKSWHVFSGEPILFTGIGAAALFLLVAHRNGRQRLQWLLLITALTATGALVSGCGSSSSSSSPVSADTDTAAAIIFPLENLNTGTTYYWRVRAEFDDGTYSDWSPSSSFHVPGADV